jgi:hypothetical protein
MTVPSTQPASRRVLRTHIPERAGQIGMSVRAADRSLRLDGGGHRASLPAGGKVLHE